MPWEGLFLLPRSARVSKKIGEYFRISENIVSLSVDNNFLKY